MKKMVAHVGSPRSGKWNGLNSKLPPTGLLSDFALVHALLCAWGLPWVSESRRGWLDFCCWVPEGVLEEVRCNAAKTLLQRSSQSSQSERSAGRVVPHFVS